MSILKIPRVTVIFRNDDEFYNWKLNNCNKCAKQFECDSFMLLVSMANLFFYAESEEKFTVHGLFAKDIGIKKNKMPEKCKMFEKIVNNEK